MMRHYRMPNYVKSIRRSGNRRYIVYTFDYIGHYYVAK